MLDDAGFHDVKIIVSNDLDEVTILSLLSQGAKVDSWGIGTKLITAYDQPALGAVYKLVAIENDEGELENRIKISGNPEKVTTAGEHIKPLLMFHPIHTMKRNPVDLSRELWQIKQDLIEESSNKTLE